MPIFFRQIKWNDGTQTFVFSKTAPSTAWLEANKKLFSHLDKVFVPSVWPEKCSSKISCLVKCIISSPHLIYIYIRIVKKNTPKRPPSWDLGMASQRLKTRNWWQWRREPPGGKLPEICVSSWRHMRDMRGRTHQLLPPPWFQGRHTGKTWKIFSQPSTDSLATLATQESLGFFYHFITAWLQLKLAVDLL